MSEIQDQLVITGSLLTLNLFEEKLMRNFHIINNRLKKLQSMGDIETKTKHMEKELKFLNTKVESIVQKIPKDGNAISKKEVINVCKDQVFDIFNNSLEKLNETEFFKLFQIEFDKLKAQVKQAPKNHLGPVTNSKQPAAKQASFTAGTILLSESKKNVQASQQLLNDVLTKQENRIVSQIMSSDDQMSEFDKVKRDIANLYQTIDSLKISLSKQNFVFQEMNEYEKYQRENNSKSQQKGRKRKSPNKNTPANQQGQEDQQNIGTNQGEKSKRNHQISHQVQKQNNRNKLETSINGKSQIIAKQDLLTRKTMQLNQQIKSPSTLVNKDDLSVVFINGPSNQRNSVSNAQQHFNKLGELTKIEYIPENKLLSKAQRSKSLKKLQRIQKKLRVDDIKDINSVLKEIQLRLQSKANLDIVTEFIKQFEEKLQIIRITKDQSQEINDLRKMFYNMDSKLQSIINYLQSMATEDDALIVKKNWTCISCDKMIEKFNGKLGQHVNWDSVQAKKLSPAKVGAFGQAGQLASKIKHLMENAGQ